MIAYKVVCNNYGRYGSFAITMESKLHLTYEIGKTTKACPGSLGIFCFKDIEYTKVFRNPLYLQYPVLKVEATGEKGPYSLTDAQTEDPRLDRGKYDASPLYGTAWFEEVTPLEVVEE